MRETQCKDYLIDVLVELTGSKRSELTKKLKLLHDYEIAGICIAEARRIVRVNNKLAEANLALNLRNEKLSQLETPS